MSELGGFKVLGAGFRLFRGTERWEINGARKLLLCLGYCSVTEISTHAVRPRRSESDGPDSKASFFESTLQVLEHSSILHLFINL